jgi:chromosome segregation ATPase
MTPEEIKGKIEDLQKRTDAVNQKRAGLSGQLEAKKEELAAIVQEARAAGYDPKNLAVERDKTQKEVEVMIAEYETKLTEVEAALSAFDKK